MSSSSSSYVATRSVFHFIQKRFLASNVDVNLHNQSASILSTATKTAQLNPKISAKHAPVLSFFKSLGFTDAHISKLVAKNPKCLTADVEKTLKPKIDCLVDHGISGSFLHDFIVADPWILRKGLTSELLPTLRLLQTYLGSNEKVAAAVKRSSWLLSYGNKDTMERNVKHLVSEGVPMKSISNLISKHPRLITFNVDRMVHALKSAKQFGFHPVDPMLVYAIAALLKMSESTMSKKTEFLKNLLGLSEEVVKSMFKGDPQCFTKSEEKMKNVANFFINIVRVESSFLPSVPRYFSYSIDKRMVPRYTVYKILESKKLLKKGVKFTGILIRGTEDWFESNYVIKYLDHVPDLMELYRGFQQTSSTQSLIEKTKTGIL